MSDHDFLPDRPGVLPIQRLRLAAERGAIHDPEGGGVPDASFQPASVDLRLGRVAHRLRCSFLPGDEPVEAKLQEYSLGEFSLGGRGAVLEIDRPYLIPLVEELRLPPGVRARTNPKSSTGRLDIFTRVISDRSHRFDEVADGYSGKLYLEVFSRSFTVRVKAGLTLNQIRLAAGGPALEPGLARRTHEGAPILYRDGAAVAGEELARDGGVFLSVDLEATTAGEDGESDPATVVGYKARRESGLLDLTHFENNPDEFWEPIWRDRGRLVLGREQFYLLRSKERVRIPPDLAAEMVAYDPTSGELRTHYAGFFDPGFGQFEHEGPPGAAAVLEVRAHDVPFMIEDGQKVSKFSFEPMAEPPEVLYGAQVGSHYHGQPRMLSKYFRPFRGRQMPFLFG